MITIPVKTVSTLNRREHWAVRADRARMQRNAALLTVWSMAQPNRLPVVVTMTRVAPSRGLDDDNLRGALKSVRDGIADAFQVDDRDPRIQWRYEQRRGKDYAVEVEIAPA